jgi:hypothetical protein
MIPAYVLRRAPVGMTDLLERKHPTSRPAWVGVALATVLGCAGCCINKASTFAVANETGSTITVSYTFPVGRRCPGGLPTFDGLLNPRMAPLDSLPWIERSEQLADYTCDAEKGVLSLSLPQGRGVALFSALTQGCASRQDPIDTISVVGPFGARSASGMQIRANFDKYDSDLYIFHFK